MKISDLKSLMQKSNISINPHPTIEENKATQLQRTVQPTQVRPTAQPQPQRTVQPTQVRPTAQPQPQRTVQPTQVRPTAQPQPQRTVQPTQVRPTAQPQPQEKINYIPFNDAPVLSFGDTITEQIPQAVAQEVAQAVAQGSWVAQDSPKVVAQAVAQNSPEIVTKYSVISKDINALKECIFQIDGIESKKQYVRDIGWGVLTERRGKQIYLYGAKKIEGKKYKLYIGNVKA